MNIQIFGKKKCFDTKKTERWFKERRIKFQQIDLVRFGMSGGEFDSVLRAVGGVHAVGLHADVQHVHGYVVLHLAGVRAGVAPDATLKVDGDAKLGHDRSPTLS